MLLEHENVLWAGVNKVKQTQRPVKPTETSELMQSGRYFTKRDEIFKLRNNSQSRFEYDSRVFPPEDGHLFSSNLVG